MKKLVRFLILAFCVSAICTSITRAVDYTLPTDEIGILSAKIEVPTKQGLGENITIITSVNVAGKC